jgi:hypothetical protein
MGMSAHIEVYQSYTGPELAAEITRLKVARQGFLSQSVGGKSYTQDLRRVDDMLQACIRVQNQGASSGNAAMRGRADFSGN